MKKLIAPLIGLAMLASCTPWTTQLRDGKYIGKIIHIDSLAKADTVNNRNKLSLKYLENNQYKVGILVKTGDDGAFVVADYCDKNLYEDKNLKIDSLVDVYGKVPVRIKTRKDGTKKIQWGQYIQIDKASFHPRQKEDSSAFWNLDTGLYWYYIQNTGYDFHLEE